MPGRDGIELLRGPADRGCDANIFIASGLENRVLTTAEQLGKSLGLEIAGSFCKPIALDELQALLVRHKQEEKVITADDAELTMDILARLRVKNVHLCLDDFGVGYSSLTHLYQMPFSEVKLDNSFIDDMRTNEDARAMVDGLIYLSHKLKMKACAEGVQDEATLVLLEGMSCDRAQGHYIWAAVRPSELEALVGD